MEPNLIEKLEAILFASGKAMTIDSMIAILGYDNKKSILSSLKKLKIIYDERKSPLMIIEQDNAWKLTVREEYLPLIRNIVADTELSKTVLETLSVIAWKSPVLQSNVIKVRTNKAYEHIDQLEKLGFITRKKEGRSFKISLAEKFFEYFDVEKGDIHKMFKSVKRVEKELEEEQKKHIENNTNSILLNNNHNSISTQSKVSGVIDDEKAHLGNLEVVDAISVNSPESVEIVDSISDSDVQESTEIPKENKTSSSELVKEKEIDEVIEEIDNEEKVNEEVNEILES